MATYITTDSGGNVTYEIEPVDKMTMLPNANSDASEAAQAAQEAARTAQEAAAGVAESAAQIETNTNNITDLSDEITDLKDALNNAPSEEMGAELLAAEISETELLYELLYKLIELPSDETLAKIRDELVDEAEWLEVIRAEIEERLTEVV